MKRRLRPCLCIGSLLAFSAALIAQTSFPPGRLDPTRNISSPQMIDAGHAPLPEQYIWNAEQPQPGQTPAQAQAERSSPCYFRASFQIAAVPRHATLYIAGPRKLEAYINGQLAERDEINPDSPLEMTVFAVDVSQRLRTGANTIALKLSPNPDRDRDETYFVAKIVPRSQGIDAPALLITDGNWKSTLHPGSDWQAAQSDDSSWNPVHTFGPIESSLEFFQGNIDAGLYRWPGYIGASRFLAHIVLPAQSVHEVFSGRGSYTNLDALTQSTPAAPDKQFTVHLASANAEQQQQAPSILLDFGKEVNGRLRLVSASDQPIYLTIQYGESRDETVIQPYLGVDPITVLPHATAYGPKSAFRFAKIRFLGSGDTLRLQSIGVDAIYYPVQYRGSFESSDPLLNKIWEIGAYTSHLCMQDDIWDAPKRDRRRWAGDLDVSGRVIEDTFADRFLMQDTLTKLIGKAPVKTHVNDIAGYSAWWISAVTQYYLHTGSTAYLNGLHQRLVQLLNYMDTEIDAKNLFADTTHTWGFVDWSPELNGDTPEARRATQFEYYLAYRDGASLLRDLGDTANAQHFDQRAQLLKNASQKYLLDPSTNTFGDRWQTNAIAVYSGVADPAQYAPIWDHVLSTVATTKYTAFFMSPYYNYYIISAMAETGHSRQALDWIRTYWGGMIAEGATSWWEAYYPSWPKRNFHASLQADDGTGYYVSLSHGWSSGPTAFLMEQILGIQPTAAGFSKVTIRPDLAGLEWAKGAEPTPHGLLKVSLENKNGLQTTIDVPPGVEADVLVPVKSGNRQILENGKAVNSTGTSKDENRATVVLTQPGHYVLEAAH